MMCMEKKLIHSFAPVIDKGCKILIIGSIPSLTSLGKQEYYGYKHNRFWPMIERCFQVSLITYQDKIECLKSRHIALWDVIQSCEREGSLDSNIKGSVCNDIEGLLKQYPSIKCILCNGKKSHTLYQKHFSHLQVKVISLPSTSNANATIKKEELLNTWIEHIQNYV